MDKRQILRECAENLALLTQLGLSLAAPPVLLLLGAAQLIRRYGLHSWIMAPALLLGIAGSLGSAWCFWRRMQRRQSRDAQPLTDWTNKRGGEQHEKEYDND